MLVFDLKAESVQDLNATGGNQNDMGAIRTKEDSFDVMHGQVEQQGH